MRKRLMLFVTLLAMVATVGIVFASMGCGSGKKTISQIVFTTSGRTITTGAVSSSMAIQTQDTKGNALNVGGNTAISLASTSSAGKFDTSASGAFDGSITSVTIPKGDSSVSFYYKDTAAGTPTITASYTGWTSATQQETVTSTVSKIVFATAAQTISFGSVSAAMTIHTQDTYGNPASVDTVTTISLASTSSTGRFDTSASGAFDGSITSVTLSNGGNSISFYYKDTTAGAPTITASYTGWTTASQQESIT